MVKFAKMRWILIYSGFEDFQGHEAAGMLKSEGITKNLAAAWTPNKIEILFISKKSAVKSLQMKEQIFHTQNTSLYSLLSYLPLFLKNWNTGRLPAQLIEA